MAGQVFARSCAKGVPDEKRKEIMQIAANLFDLSREEQVCCTSRSCFTWKWTL